MCDYFSTYTNTQASDTTDYVSTSIVCGPLHMLCSFAFPRDDFILSLTKISETKYMLKMNIKTLLIAYIHLDVQCSYTVYKSSVYWYDVEWKGDFKGEGKTWPNGRGLR